MEESRPRFMRIAPFVQSMMATGDSLTGSYAMLYAVGRGSVGFIQGFITSVQQLGAAVLQPVWGAWSDRMGRRGFMVTGLLIQAFAWAVLLPMAETALQVLMVLTFQTLFGTMVLPVWNAWMGDYTSKSDRGRIFGRFGLVASWIALMIFATVSLFIQSIDPTRSDVNSFSIAFRAAGVFYLIGAVVVLSTPQAERFNGNGKRRFTWKTSRVQVAGFLVTLRQLSTRSSIRRRFQNGVRSLSPQFKRFLLIDGLFRIAWSIAWPIFPYATLSATMDWIQLVILQVTIGLSIGVSGLIGGRLADRFGRKGVILWTRIFLVIPPVLHGIAVLHKLPILLVISNLVVGLTLGATSIAINSMILDTAPKGKESTYFSIYIFLMGVIGFFSSMFMGWLLSIFSGDSIPNDKVVAYLLFGAGALRLIIWVAYFFLPETATEENY